MTKKYHNHKAKRELREESGAVEFDIKPICAYSVKGKTKVTQSQIENLMQQSEYYEGASEEEISTAAARVLGKLKTIYKSKLYIVFFIYYI